ncbi:sensor histidine kinase [Moorena sp. SIO3H5]|uniref:sensor histidine kinase n=1 Tax=Moorena sp. SIO3H5 TaxID=2607834 RepID=UPI0013BC9E2F|nr:sensor histidine kinase [Moorena sp. SIO3H5]NEO74289.1 sensor histidine kinase [Moorena sp. SIO3H5]
MRHPIQITNHPIRFLLYLEWILLIITALVELLKLPFPMLPRSPLLNLVCLAVFGLMGLRLPTNKPIYKILYSAAEIGVIVLASIVGHIRLLQLMLIILVVRNCFIFEFQGRLMMTGFAVILFLMKQMVRFQHHGLRHRPPFRPPPVFRAPPTGLIPERLLFILLTSVFIFVLVLIVLQLLVDAVLSERKSREELAKANAQLRHYALRIEDIATLQERNRIAREIHDSLGHSLTVFNLHLEAALRLLQSDPDEAKEFILEAKQLGKTALKDVRQSVASLRLNPLQQQSLENAIASLIEDFQKSTAISPTCHLHLKRSIPADIKIAVYRIVQEGLTNIFKYANPTEVDIQIQTAATALQLIIKDNGIGFSLNQNTTGFGLQGMRERTQALGGTFKIETAPGAGCQIIAHFPLPKV